MSKTIWKYEIETEGRNVVKMPLGAEILTVQLQLGKPCIWALVEEDEPLVQRWFEVFGTGHHVGYDMGVSRKYIGTYQLREGALIFHVFESTGV